MTLRSLAIACNLMIVLAVFGDMPDEELPGEVRRREIIEQARRQSAADFLKDKDYDRMSAWIEIRKDWSRDALAKDVSQLFGAISDPAPSPIVPLNDISVRSRVIKKKMIALAGGGLDFRQDVLSVSGRAAWALEELLHVELPEIAEDMSVDERLKAQSEAGKTIIEVLMKEKPSSTTAPTTTTQPME